MHLRLNSSRRLRLAAAFTTALVVSLLVLPPSQAVHDEGFALQGNLFGTGTD